MNTRLIGRAATEPVMLRASEHAMLMRLALHHHTNGGNGGEGTLGLRAHVMLEMAGIKAAAGKKAKLAEAAGNAGKAKATAGPAPERAVAWAMVGGYETVLYSRIGSVAVVPVMGVLDLREGDVRDSNNQSFGTSYETLKLAAQAAAADPLVGGVMLYVDSPGGAAVMCGATAKLIAGSVKAAGKPLWAYSDGGCYSAALYIASQSDVMLIGENTGVGSIGCIMYAVDETAYWANEGVRVEAIKSNEMKDIGSPYRAMTDEERKLLQERVDAEATAFIEAVAAGRKLTAEQVRALSATPEFVGAAAVNAKIVQGVALSVEEAIARFAAAMGRGNGQQSGGPVSRKGTSASKTMEPAALADLKAAFGGNDPAFLMDCLEGGLSMEAAKAKHSARELANLKAEKDTLSKELAAAQSQLKVVSDKLAATEAGLKEATAKLESPAVRRALLGVTGGSPKAAPVGENAGTGSMAFTDRIAMHESQGKSFIKAVADAKAEDREGWGAWQASRPKAR
jgi:signal peptide peptidase SppA